MAFFKAWILKHLNHLDISHFSSCCHRFFFLINIFIWLCQVSVVTHGIFCCSDSVVVALGLSCPTTCGIFCYHIFFFQLLQPLSGTSLLWCLCPPSLLVQVQQLLIPLLSNTKVSSPLPLLHPCYTLHGPSGLDLRLPFHSESSGWYLQWSLCSHIQCTRSRPHLKSFFNSLWLCQPFYFTKYFSLGFYDLTTCFCSFFLSSHTTSISFVGYPLPPACMQWNCLKPSPNQSFSS